MSLIIMFLVCSSSIFDIVLIDNEFMYKFAKRLALDARELGDRSHVSVVLRCYLSANVSYLPSRVVVRDSDSFVDSYIVHPPLIGQAEPVLWSKSCDVLIYFINVPYT
jgi:hypothetical protein